MDGSRRRRHAHGPQSAWLATYRTARWARRFLGRQLPALAFLAACAARTMAQKQRSSLL